MLHSRYCFGYCLLDAFHFLVAGGALSSYVQSDKVDLYDMQSDIWLSLPSLTEKKFRPTLVQVKSGSIVYCFGGQMYNEEQTRIMTNRTTCRVERVDIEGIMKMRRGLAKSFPGKDIEKRYQSIVETMKWQEVSYTYDEGIDPTK